MIKGTIYVKGGSRTPIPKFMSAVKQNFEELSNKAIAPIMVHASKVAKTQLRVGGRIGFEGDLKNAVAYTKTKRRGKLYLRNNNISGSGNTIQQVAYMNEFGVRPHKVYFNKKDSNKQKLFRWAKIHNPSAFKKGYITVGGKNSRVKLGASQNMFWQPTFWRMNMRIRPLIEDQLTDVFQLKYTGGIKAFNKALGN